MQGDFLEILERYLEILDTKFYIQHLSPRPFRPTILEKVFGKEIEQNWTRTEKFDICLYVPFDCYRQSFISGW